jgi:hypothetical protein
MMDPTRVHRTHVPARPWLLLALVPGLGWWGCGASLSPPGVGPEAEAISLAVVNQSGDPVHVYAIRAGGARVPLGRVPAGRTAEISVPAELVRVGSLHLAATRAGAAFGYERYVGVVSHLDRLEWRLEHSPSGLRFPSVLRVRPGRSGPGPRSPGLYP